MRVAIVGSRTYRRLDLVRDCVARLHAWSVSTGNPLVIVSGTEPGEHVHKDRVDETVIRHARSLGVETVVYAADWKNQGKKAGVVRNQTIVDDSDWLVCFWDGRSRGSFDVLSRAITKGIVRKVYDADGNAMEPKAFYEALKRIQAKGTQ
jgi:hypothetical protein